ncbi:MAG: transposase [Patescibacteria group bacterium]|nr:transposase [Patescibacteria group bacterium]
MKNIKFHRNSQKRFYGDDKIYFITTITRERFPFFKENLFCELFMENLRICKKLKKFKLYAFTIIPNHVHLLLKPENDFNISKVMQSLKKSFSRDFNNFIYFANNKNIPSNNYIEGEIHESRLQYNCCWESRLQGKQYSFRQNKIFAIPKYEKYIKQINKFKNMPKFKWQQSFHDHVIRNEKDFLKHLNYIALNCVKHKLCEDETKYKWSSLNFEFGDFVDDWQ